MKKKIEEALKVLIGLPLWNAGRSATVEWFDFGWKRTTLPTKNGGTTIVGEYVLDTESAWQIASSNEIVVASQDRLYPAGNDPYKDLLEFDWDKQGANRCDERIKLFLDDHKDAPLIVESIQANNLGGLKIILSGGYHLEIFQNTSLESV